MKTEQNYRIESNINICESRSEVLITWFNYDNCIQWSCFILCFFKAATFVLYNIKRLVFITEVESAYCVVRTDPLNDIHFVFKGLINYHHHVPEGLGMLSCSLILKMKLVPPSLLRSSYVSSSFWFIL